MNELLVAVDIGNSVVKGGLFRRAANPPESEPLRIAEAPLDEPALIARRLSLDLATATPWFVSSVNRPAEQRLRAWLFAERPADAYRLLTHADIPLRIKVDFPAQVGFDRLATAVAADALRPAHQAAIVVDAGTALKVHAVSADGQFLGGAILPGFRLAAQSLQRGTDLLPLVDASLNISPPDVLGRNTQSAIRAGLYWGAVGAVRELVTRLRFELGPATPVFVTGGDAQGLGALIDDGLQFVPHLCLTGIARVARRLLGA